MLNLNMLDTLIAVVVVLLTLSFVVQSIQAAIKKLFKLKSHQLEESLIDLFENALIAKSDTDFQHRSRMPAMRLFSGAPNMEKTAPAVRALFESVQTKFKEIGRVDSGVGKGQALDSLTKDHLLLILNSINPDALVPGATEKLKAATEQLAALRAALEEVNQLSVSGVASAQFAKIQQVLTPLLNDLNQLFAGENLKTNLLLNDLLNLRDLNSTAAFDLLGTLQQQVQTDLATAQSSNDAAKVSGLKNLETGLQKLTSALTAVCQAFASAIAPLKLQLQAVENWYDIVMRSFEERYNRAMKTWAFFIGLAVAICLNANIFSVYQDIATNEAMRTAIVQAGETTLQKLKEAQLNAQSSNEKKDAPGQQTAPGQQEKKNAEPPVDLKKQFEDKRKEIQKEVEDYQRFGFQTWGEWKKQAAEHWHAGLLRFVWFLFTTGLGWVLMAALLSVGAPFWQDVLESLFGVKNFLRKRSGNTQEASST